MSKQGVVGRHMPACAAIYETLLSYNNRCIGGLELGDLGIWLELLLLPPHLMNFKYGGCQGRNKYPLSRNKKSILQSFVPFVHILKQTHY